MKSSRSCAAYRGSRISGLFRVLGQPNLNFTVDREQAARYGINVSDVQDAIQTAVGGNALTQVLSWRTAIRPGAALFAAISRHAGGHREDSFAVAHGRTCFAGAIDASKCGGWRFGDLSRSELPIYRGEVQRARQRPGQHGGRSHQEGRTPPSSCRPDTPSTGRANTKARSARSGGCCWCCRSRSC